MIRYILGRFVSLIVSLIVASIVIFAVIEIAPGDPASFMLGINAQPDTVAALREELGLNVSKPERYFNWVTGMLVGDFGTSYTYRAPIADLIADRIMVSLPLAIYALILSTLIAFPAGIFAASRRGGIGDMSVMGATQLGVAIPNFWFAMIMVLIFAINLRWFPPGGFPGWDAGFWTGLKALTLPAIALALPQAAILARVMRSSLLDMLGEDFMRTARAKGLPETVVILKHGLRNAGVTVLSILGLQIAGLAAAGNVVVEAIFSWPGIGELLVNAAITRDYPVLQFGVITVAAAVIVINALTDIAYAYADPRIRLGKG